MTQSRVRRRGHTPGWLLSAFGRFTFGPSPTGFKDTFRVWAGGPLRRESNPASASGTGDREGRPYGGLKGRGGEPGGPVWDRPLRKDRYVSTSAVGAGVLTRPPVL